MPRHRVKMVGRVNGRLKVVANAEPDLITRQTMLLVECQNPRCRHRKEMQIGNFQRATRCMICEGMRKDLTGQKNGKLEVLRFDFEKDQKAYWLCRCDCGEEVTLNTNAVAIEKQKSCGRCPRDRLDDALRVRNHLLLVAKRNANRGGFEWALSDDEAWTLMQSNCVYCAAPPAQRRFWEKDKRNRTIAFAVNGIRRLDRKLGFTRENVVPCCKGSRHRMGRIARFVA